MAPLLWTVRPPVQSEYSRLVPSDAAPAQSHETCPYRGLADHAYWSRSVARPVPGAIDPLANAPFKISRADRIATAGSCFAQHLAKRLSASGFNYLVVEPGYPRMGTRLATKFNYGTFSARYGNLYTARQLLQLLQRAYGTFVPGEPFWQDGPYWIDPFRPLIQPMGFESLREAELDRIQHLAAVRETMETLDVFIFTLGLTEAWVCKSDGAVLPICPGCGVGKFDPERYAFRNFEFEEVLADLEAFAASLRQVNPRARIILTVSPVPLVATYSGSHVLPATVYSKSVLRVAADRAARSIENCLYFPSYEIITAPFSHGAYFENDLRNVAEAGVDHVMKVFFRHLSEESEAPGPGPSSLASAADAGPGRGPNVMDLICEEYASLNAVAEGR